jgi:hypothetical protein
MEPKVSIFNMNTIELHYWLKDGSHSMDAHVFNKCEYEFLGIVNELTLKLKIKITVEVEPIGEGGIRAWFKFSDISGNDVKKAFLIFLLTQVLCTPLTTTFDYMMREVLEWIFEDPEIKALENEKKKAELKLDLAKIKSETERLSRSIDENKLQKKRSNYYETARKCNKIEKITITGTDSYREKEYVKKDVFAVDFVNYIMTSDDLEPDEDDKAVIEIISPVLKKGRYQWLGIYQNEVIQFKMRSVEFKDMVLTGQIPFKNGSSITCLLIRHKKIDNQGDVKITGYEVLEVYNYFQNDTPIETPAGKRRRQRNEAEKKQLKIFNENDFL